MEELNSRDRINSKRNKIIEEVLTHGLKSATALVDKVGGYLGSSDQENREHVSGALVDPVSNIGVEDALYNGYDSVIPVLAERKGERYFFKPKADEIHKFEDRAQSSFLVVYEKTPDETFTSRKIVLPAEMTYLVFPKGVWEKYPDDLKQKTNTPVKIVEDNIRKKVHGAIQGAELLVPNYETVVRQIWEQTYKPFLIHGVRLPTGQD